MTYVESLLEHNRNLRHGCSLTLCLSFCFLQVGGDETISFASCGFRWRCQSLVLPLVLRQCNGGAADDGRACPVESAVKRSTRNVWRSWRDTSLVEQWPAIYTFRVSTNILRSLYRKLRYEPFSSNCIGVEGQQVNDLCTSINTLIECNHWNSLQINLFIRSTDLLFRSLHLYLIFILKT